MSDAAMVAVIFMSVCFAISSCAVSDAWVEFSKHQACDCHSTIEKTNRLPVGGE